MSVSLYFGPSDFSKSMTVSYPVCETNQVMRNVGQMIMDEVEQLPKRKHLTCLGPDCLKRGRGHTVKVGFAMINGKCEAKVIAGVFCGNQQCESSVKEMLKQKVLNDLENTNVIEIK